LRREPGIISQKRQRQGDGSADRTRYGLLYDLFSAAGVIIPRALKPRFPAARVFTLLNGKIRTADVLQQDKQTLNLESVF